MDSYFATADFASAAVHPFMHGRRQRPPLPFDARCAQESLEIQNNIDDLET
jgi:hypothetical protein